MTRDYCSDYPDIMRPEDIDLINQLNIPFERVTYADGLVGNALQAEMYRLGAWVAYGTNPCKNGGHRLKWRSKHCFVCNPRHIKEYKQNEIPGYFYLLRSGKKLVFKIGITNDLQTRIRQVNSDAYGGYVNWSLVDYEYCDANLRRVEIDAQRILKRYQVTEDVQYEHSTGTVDARDVYRIPRKMLTTLQEQIFAFARGER